MSPSTTMTFATTVKILKEDYKIWEKYASHGVEPDDLDAWSALTQKTWRSAYCLFHARMLVCFAVIRNILLRKNTRTLISAIPAFATHSEVGVLAPIIEWSNE